MRNTITRAVRFGAGGPAALIAALSLAASGCSLALDTSKLDPLSTPEGYCKVLFGEFLRLWTSCYPATQQWFDIQYEQAAAMCDKIGGSESRGAIAYDESAARAWVDKVRSATCTDNLDDVMYNADSPFVGQVPNGGYCADRFECADDRAECQSVDATCPGTCILPGGLGASCAAGYPPCDVGFYCGASGTCAPALPTGGNCSANPSACGAGAYCWYCGSVCNPPYQCRPYATEGNPCNSADMKCDPDAERWIFCDDLNSGTCKRGGSLADGQLCRGGECEPATFCGGSGSPGVCQRKLGYAAPCSAGECMPPLDCIGDSMIGTAAACLPRRQVGDACRGGSNDCVMGAYCVAPSDATGHCEPWPSAYDQACGPVTGEWAFCLTGWCDTGGVLGPGVCRPFLSPGSSCASSPEACGGNGLLQTGRCDWATVGGNAVQVCVPNCLGL